MVKKVVTPATTSVCHDGFAELPEITVADDTRPADKLISHTL
jgi:hypothetical protein